MSSVVDPKEVADLLRRLAECNGRAKRMRAKLAPVDGPLATLATLRIETVETIIEDAIEMLHSGAEIVVSVSGAD